MVVLLVLTLSPDFASSSFSPAPIHLPNDSGVYTGMHSVNPMVLFFPGGRGAQDHRM